MQSPLLNLTTGGGIGRDVAFRIPRLPNQFRPAALPLLCSNHSPRVVLFSLREHLAFRLCSPKKKVGEGGAACDPVWGRGPDRGLGTESTGGLAPVTSKGHNPTCDCCQEGR